MHAPQQYKNKKNIPVENSTSKGTASFTDQRPSTQRVAQLKEAAMSKADGPNQPKPTIQKKTNSTGLPDKLKTGIENLSGHSLDDVKVHFNSSKPAQLNAHAYAQGNQIHLASGQEKHLPHEAWHVVQQKQGRVQPTKQMNGNVNINDHASLEKEADVMGEKALQLKVKSSHTTVHRKGCPCCTDGNVVQRVAGKNTRVRNLIGTSHLKAPGKVSWKKHHQSVSKRKWSKCCASGCRRYAKVGAHVEIDSQGSSTRNRYIIPFCQKHNKMNTTKKSLGLKKNSTLVSVGKTKRMLAV